MWSPCPPFCIYFCPLTECWLWTLVVLIGCSLVNPLGVTPFLYFLSLCARPCLSIISLSLIFSTEVRSEERGILEKAGVVQSLTVGVAPIVVVIASACTFTLHMALGYDLTAAEVFKYGNLLLLFLLTIKFCWNFLCCRSSSFLVIMTLWTFVDIQIRCKYL